MCITDSKEITSVKALSSLRGRQHVVLRGSQAGVTLIELVVFIVIVGISVAGVLLAINRTAINSASPLATKQALAIAESLLEEIELMPYTYCDPDDAQVTTATSAVIGVAGCATLVEAMGPEAGESRTSVTLPFDNVNDYNGFSMSPIRDINNTLISGLSAYSASVTVANAALGVIPAANSLLITVTVTGPQGTRVVLQGYRTQYAPAF